MHTEWKIKRLQLDQSRMQLLSTEERNLKREKLELEHQKSEEMSKSVQSNTEEELSANNKCPQTDEIYQKKESTSTNIPDSMTESCNSVVMLDVEEKNYTNNLEHPKKQQSSGDVLSAICNVAKSFFGVLKSNDKICDNKRNLDSQGNIVNEYTTNTEHTTSSNVIGADIEQSVDNEQFLIARKEALNNKLKVMAHEFGQADNENNLRPTITTDPLDENLNEEWSPFVEARRNKLKVLGEEYKIMPKVKTVSEPTTDAHREAIINKQRVLGVEYNLPAEAIVTREPANVAQEEAIRNKKKVLTSEYESRPSSSRRDRSGLTLNLKPYEAMSSDNVTPNTAVTPGDLFPRVRSIYILLY